MTGLDLSRLTWPAVVVVALLVALTALGFVLDHSVIALVLGPLGAVGTLAVHSLRTPPGTP
jgi:hypothetical protein